MRDSLVTAKRVVIKVGTRVVARDDGRVALGRIGMLIEQIAELRERGVQVLLVSSGAILLGADRLGLEPKSVADQQACAAAGQGALVAFYDALTRRLGIRTAQVLLTEGDFHDRRRYVNLSGALERLLSLGALPVINENDAVSTAGLDPDRARVFGDNDRLAALVAAGLDADVLVLLTNVDGIFTLPPSEEGAVRIPTWTEDEVRFGSVSHGGRGGMKAKVEAACVANGAGVHVVVANGFNEGVLHQVLGGEDVGTLFPGDARQARHRTWLRFATSPAGVLVVNDGARDALLQRNASLLPVGCVHVDGDFAAGEVVAIADESGHVFARGVCRPSSEEARGRLGKRGEAVLVHRSRLIVLEAP